MKINMKKDFQYYLDHQAALVKKYGGQFVVIKNQEVIGSYDSELKAVQETAKTHTLGTFIVQKCEPGEDSHTNVFHSRVVFA